MTLSAFWWHTGIPAEEYRDLTPFSGVESPDYETAARSKYLTLHVPLADGIAWATRLAGCRWVADRVYTTQEAFVVVYARVSKAKAKSCFS